MKSDQWFQLWMTLLSGLVTLVAVWIGAGLALSGQRRGDRERAARDAAASFAEPIHRLARAISGVTAIERLKDSNDDGSEEFSIALNVDDATRVITQLLIRGADVAIEDRMLRRALAYCASLTFEEGLQGEQMMYAQGVFDCLVAYSNGVRYEVPWFPVVDGDLQPRR